MKDFLCLHVRNLYSRYIKFRGELHLIIHTWCIDSTAFANVACGALSPDRDSPTATNNKELVSDFSSERKILHEILI